MEEEDPAGPMAVPVLITVTSVSSVYANSLKKKNKPRMILVKFEVMASKFCM